MARSDWVWRQARREFAKFGENPPRKNGMLNGTAGKVRKRGENGGESATICALNKQVPRKEKRSFALNTNRNCVKKKTNTKVKQKERK